VNAETGAAEYRPFCARRYTQILEQFTAMCPTGSDFLLLDNEFRYGLRRGPLER
jgi:hypothetical protein